jgi:hypothetical protein
MPPQHGRRRVAGEERGERGIAGECRDGEPDQAERRERQPDLKAEQEPDIGPDALAAFEAEPPWEEVTEQRGEGSADRRVSAKHRSSDGDRDRALDRVVETRRRGERLAAGAQHVGSADIAGAGRAQIKRAGKPRQHDAERNRARRIFRQERLVKGLPPALSVPDQRMTAMWPSVSSPNGARAQPRMLRLRIAFRAAVAAVVFAA